MSKDIWGKVVGQILRFELNNRQISYAELKKRLAEIGIEESIDNLKNKVTRGTFRAAFFLQALHAIGVKNLPLSLVEELLKQAKAAE